MENSKEKLRLNTLKLFQELRQEGLTEAEKNLIIEKIYLLNLNGIDNWSKLHYDAKHWAYLTQNDILQMTRMYLFEAIPKFDATKGDNFQVFASIFIRQRMKREYAVLKHNREATLSLNSLVKPKPGEESDTTIEEVVPNDDDDIAQTVVDNIEKEGKKNLIAKAVYFLPKAQKDLILARYFGAKIKTFREIGTCINCSKQNAQQIEEKAWKNFLNIFDPEHSINRKMSKHTIRKFVVLNALINKSEKEILALLETLTPTQQKIFQLCYLNPEGNIFMSQLPKDLGDNATILAYQAQKAFKKLSATLGVEGKVLKIYSEERTPTYKSATEIIKLLNDDKKVLIPKKIEQIEFSIDEKEQIKQKLKELLHKPYILPKRYMFVLEKYYFIEPRMTKAQIAEVLNVKEIAVQGYINEGIRNLLKLYNKNSGFKLKREELIEVLNFRTEISKNVQEEQI